jgi:hypothetical protein
MENGGCMPRRKLTLGKPGGSAKRGEMVSASGVAYVAKRDTDSSPPGEHWQPAIVRSEAFAGLNGRDGADGRDGKPGKDAIAKDGTPGASFVWIGEWINRRRYKPLECVRHDNASWVAIRESQGREPGEASSYWDLLVVDGRAGKPGEDGGGGQRGRRGPAGDSAATDLELVFDETAKAGQVVELSSPNHCRVANGLSFYRCRNILGLAVADTLGGSTGKVRTIGLLTLRDWSEVIGCESLRPRSYYAFHNYGKLTTDGQPENTAIKWTLGSAISDDTFLVNSGFAGIHLMNTRPITAPCLSTLPKGAPVYLATQTEVDAATMFGDNSYWKVAGVLVDDVEAGGDATYKGMVDITKDDWSDVLESADTLLVVNTKYYLADTPGKLTTDSEDRLFIGEAETTKRLAVDVGDDSPDYPIVA